MASMIVETSPALRSTPPEILDLPSDAELKKIVELAASICHTPISLVSLLTADRQWFRASVGTHLRQTRRDISFCAHAIEQTGLFVVEDTLQDVRFASSPLVTGDPEMRFYAGMPLFAPDRKAIGTLCVIDQRPRRLNESQEHALRLLAEMIQNGMRLRAEHRALEQALIERDRATAQLHSNERLFQAFMNNGPLLASIKDPAGRFVFYNTRLAERFGVTMDQWIGRTDAELWPAEQARHFREHDLQALEQNRLLISEETICEDDVCSTWRSYKFPCEDEHGRPLIAALAIDVSDHQRLETELADARHELERLAAVDTLTGLPRRPLLDERLQAEFERAADRRLPLSLAILDVDNLRLRNQRFGQSSGDDVLTVIGAILRETITEADLAVRFSGAEFGILLPETTAAEAKALAERVQHLLRARDWGMLPVTLSIGIATSEHARRSGRQLLCFADDAMYSAKKAGKNRVVLYSPR